MFLLTIIFLHYFITNVTSIKIHANQDLTRNTNDKFIDIYTNYPNLQNILNQKGYSKIVNVNNSTKVIKNKNLTNKNESWLNYNRKYRTEFVKIQSEKYLDPEIAQYDPDDYEYESPNIQKISRSFTAPNSKQLEPNYKNNENFFTKINTVIKNQFNKLFKFGKNDENTTENTETNRNHPNGNLNENTDKKRFLNIFTILQFENSRCQAQGNTVNYEGTCYHRLECTDRGGEILGTCAKGYGVCCIFRNTCGGSTNQNTSYFECNPNTVFPTVAPTTAPPTTSVPDIDPRLNYSIIPNRYEEIDYLSRQATGTGNNCIFTVNKRRADVRQLRIDFLDLDLRGPTNGVCNIDRLVITGGNTNMPIPVICGYNTGQHIYVDVSDVTGPIRLSVSTTNPAEKQFRIKVSQIRAPCANFMNCLQYFTGPNGVIQTLNYDPSPRGLGVAQYFNNLNYAICIKKEPGYCTITYTNVQNGVAFPFQLTNVDAGGGMLIPPGQAGVEIFNCPDDYIIVNGIRLCGERLNDGTSTSDFRVNSPVTDNTGGPFILPVRTNGQNVGRGFKLYYRQNLCS